MDRPSRFPGLVLALYPRAFKHEFGDQWLADVDGRLARGDRPVDRLRLYWLLVLDALRAVPVAYATHAFTRLRLGRTRRRVAGAGGDTRRGGGRPPFDVLRLDLRLAVRSLWKDRSYSVTAIASLALGVTAATVMYAVVNTALIRPLPYRDPARLAMLWNAFSVADRPRLPFSGPELMALREAPDLFAEVGAIWATSGSVRGDEMPETVSLGLVSDNFFTVLGVVPSLGRIFDRGEEGPSGSGVVLVSDAYWRTSLGADPSAVGRTIRLDGREVVIIGVLAPDFTLRVPPDAGVPARLDLYTPFPWSLSALAPDSHFLRLIGRLAPAVPWGEAQARVTAVANGVRARYTELIKTGDTFSLAPLQGDAVRRVRPILLALLTGVGLFLLLAAGNVASLLIARTNARRREMAIRSCLGAPRWRIARQLLTESLVVAAVAGGVGLGLSQWGGRALWALRPEGLRSISSLSLGGPVLLFAVAVTGLTWVGFGLAPLIHLSRDPAAAILARGVDRQRQRLRKAVIVGEVAIGLVLVVGAALMAQTLDKLQQADLGFDPTHVLSARVSLPQALFPTDADRARMAQDIAGAFRRLPGVTATGAVSHLPLATWANWSDAAPPEGIPEAQRDRYHADHRSVTPGYFDAIAARLVAGRQFTEHDDGTAQPVVIIDEAMAQRAFGDADPIGRRLFPARYVDGDFPSTEAIVVGVVHDIQDRGAALSSEGQVFWPFAQSARWELTYVLRGAGDIVPLISQVRRTVGSVHRDLAVSQIRPMTDLVKANTADTSFTTMLAGLFALLALVIAAVGLYGVVTYSSQQRLRDMGIRVALGATRADIFRRIMGEGAKLGVVGVLLGVAGGIVATRLMSSLLFGVSPTDAATFLIGGIALLGTSLVASLAPARRAARVDPMTALRLE